eukprot:2799072-Amphidinium_carterae.1
MDLNELQLSLIPALPTPAPKKRAGAAAKAANPFSGVPGGCRGARVVQGVSELPTPASGAKAKPAARRTPAAAAT